MLVLSRKRGQRIDIGNDITLVVRQVRGGRVSIGIDAPEHVNIRRGEVSEPKQGEADSES